MRTSTRRRTPRHCRPRQRWTGFYATLRKGILDGTYVQGTRLGEVDQADSPEAVMRVHILSARPILLGAACDTAHDTERPGEEP